MPLGRRSRDLCRARAPSRLCLTACCRLLRAALPTRVSAPLLPAGTRARLRTRINTATPLPPALYRRAVHSPLNALRVFASPAHACYRLPSKRTDSLCMPFAAYCLAHTACLSSSAACRHATSPPAAACACALDRTRRLPSARRLPLRARRFCCRNAVSFASPRRNMPYAAASHRYHHSLHTR